MKTLFIAMLILLGSSAFGDYKPIGNSSAPQGGTFQWVFDAEPDSLNPMSSQDRYSSLAQEYVMDSLMTRNLETYQWEPALAERYEISKDKMAYTFYLRKDAKFHDGTPVTAEDVKFSMEFARNPAYKAAHLIPYFENIGNVEVIDKFTVKVPTTKKYFLNFDVIAGSFIIPKNKYADPKKKMNKVLWGSGPYKLESYDRGKSLTLVKNKEWWGKELPQNKGVYNFDKILIRFVKEDNLQIEMLKKGQLDFVEMTPEMFFVKTNGAPFGKTISKKKVENSDPTSSYGFVAWNLKNPLFEDRDVRIALAHLMNREEMIKKFRYGVDYLATGPWKVNNPHVNKSVKPFKFDPKKAKSLLAKAGWSDSNKDGVLDKTINGKLTDFRFTLMFPSRDVEKYYTMYKEDLKKAGIEMNLKLVEWNTFVKELDSKRFEAITLAWGGGTVEGDPKQIWHSESARAGGSNFISYANKEVDKLIDQAREELDAKKRSQMWQQIHKLIAEDAPYAFMFNKQYIYYGINNKIGQYKDTFKYGIGRPYFWMKN